MNAVVTVEPAQSGGSFALVPQNYSEAMDLAKMMAQNELLPKTFNGKPAHCLMVIEQAGRWRMSPFNVALGVSIISGKLMYEGKTIAAAVNTQPGMVGRLSYTYAGVGDARTITVSGTLRGEKDARTVEVRLSDAKTSNGMWVKQPDQQLAYHGARVWARRHTPEILLGVYSPEEMPDEAPRISEYRGTTIDAQAEPEAPIPEPQPAPPKPPSFWIWLADELMACGTTDDVTNVRGLPRVVKLMTEGAEDMKVRATSMIRFRYDELINATPTNPANPDDVLTDDDLASGMD